MSVINTNVKSMFAQAALQTNSRDMSRAMNQLSTGKRTYSASIDSAGLAVAEKLTTQIRGAQMAVRNMNNAISFMQTAEGAYEQVSNMAQRMYELAVQLDDATLDTDQTDSIEAEMDELSAGIDDILDNTKWNDTATDGYTLDVTVDGLATTVNFALSPLDSTPDSTTAAGTIIDFIASVGTARGEAGAHINRLSFMVDNQSNLAANLSESRSRIQDTDYAQASAELARTQIINQAATAMLAQANQQPQTVLSLLQ